MASKKIKPSQKKTENPEEIATKPEQHQQLEKTETTAPITSTNNETNLKLPEKPRLTFELSEEAAKMWKEFIEKLNNLREEIAGKIKELNCLNPCFEGDDSSSEKDKVQNPSNSPQATSVMKKLKRESKN